MKVCVKKIRCPNCERMIKCEEQPANGNIRVVCPSCKKLLYTWNGVSWKFEGKAS